MSEAEFEQRCYAAMARFARAGLAFATAYVLLFAQSHITTGHFWTAVAVGALGATNLGVPIARFALCVLAVFVLFPPPLAAAFGAWVKALV
jgi:hypothetical protein